MRASNRRAFLSVAGGALMGTVATFERGLPSVDIAVDRITPAYREVTVRPGTDVLFEIAAPNIKSGNWQTEWYVDGRRRYHRYPSISRRPHIKLIDISSRTREVQAIVYDRDAGDELGTVEWTIHVEEGAGRAPTARRVDPKQHEVLLEEGATPDITMGASDTDGDLHRALWFVGIADDPMDAVSIRGSRAESTFTYDEGPELVLLAWAVDKRGALNTTHHDGGVFSTQAVWSFARPDRERHTLRVAKDDTDKGLGVYAFWVDGTLDVGDTAEGTQEWNGALDWVGPKTGVDEYYYRGKISRFLFEGDANVYLDGRRVDPDTVGTEQYSRPPDDLPEHTLRVAKEDAADGLGVYAFQVEGRLAPGKSAEATHEVNSTLDWVGPKTGVDVYRFTGDVTSFLFEGDANVYLDGEKVDPNDL